MSWASQCPSLGAWGLVRVARGNFLRLCTCTQHVACLFIVVRCLLKKVLCSRQQIYDATILTKVGELKWCPRVRFPRCLPSLMDSRWPSSLKFSIFEWPSTYIAIFSNYMPTILRLTGYYLFKDSNSRGNATIILAKMALFRSATSHYTLPP